MFLSHICFSLFLPLLSLKSITIPSNEDIKKTLMLFLLLKKQKSSLDSFQLAKTGANVGLS